MRSLRKDLFENWCPPHAARIPTDGPIGHQCGGSGNRATRLQHCRMVVQKGRSRGRRTVKARALRESAVAWGGSRFRTSRIERERRITRRHGDARPAAALSERCDVGGDFFFAEVTRSSRVFDTGGAGCCRNTPPILFDINLTMPVSFCIYCFEVVSEST